MKEVEKDCLKVTFKTSYDRSELIKKLNVNFNRKMIAVSIVILLFFSIGEVP
jgi:hypothetical protein